MQRFFLLIIMLLSVLSSCKSNTIFEFGSTKTSEQVILGSVGSEKEFILQNNFKSTALPSYKTPIRVIASPKQFNKQVFKLFKEAESLQSLVIPITYVDSISKKPKYLQLEVADEVELIKALNNTENSNIKAYLDHNTYAQVLTNISIAFSEEDFKKITKADAVFLANKGFKKFVLQLHNKEGKIEDVLFSDGIIFQYKTSNCCWQENKKHDVDIVDLVNKYSQCPNKTYRSSRRAKKKINYYKL